MKSIWQRAYFKDIVKVGLMNSAYALGDMLGDEVLVKSFNTELKIPFVLDEHQVHSDIIGEFGAFTLMALDAPSFEKVSKKMLPEKYINNTEMRDSVLNEINNVLVASFVSKLSELLNCNIFGNVPNTTAFSAFDIRYNTRSKDGFSCRFSAFKSGVSIGFVCAFEDSVKDKVFHSQWEEKNKQIPASDGGLFSLFSKIFK